MCDYSLEHVKSRPAKVGDRLTTRDFGRVTRGFAASEDKNVAVCVLLGTELSFASEVKCARSAFVWSERVISHKTAIFRRVNQEYAWDNHDALEFPDGEIVLLTLLREGQQATVLQLPAAEKQPTSSAENKNASISGRLVDLILTLYDQTALAGGPRTMLLDGVRIGGCHDPSANSLGLIIVVARALRGPGYASASRLIVLWLTA
jgi:hypothetical protein